MKGLLVRNSFLGSSAFDALYDLFSAVAKEKGITLLTVGGAEFCTAFENTPARACDFVLFWDKDVALARRLARHGCPVFNAPDAIRICDSKAETAEVLAGASVPMPRTLVAPMTYEKIGYPDTDFVRLACDALGLPVVIKEAYGSFGEQVYLAHSLTEAKEIVLRIGARPFLFQEFIADAFGTDIRVNVVGDRAVCAMRRTGKPGDFRSNIAHGGTGELHTLSPRERELALAAVRAVGADFAGVDLLLRADGTPLVCEVNTNPHFVGTYRYTGENLAYPILDHILRSI